MAKQLIVFDFDWTIVDQDTDRWVFEVLAIDLRRRMEDLEQQIQWTDLVKESLELAHARGITRENIESALKAIPFHPAMIRALTKLKADTRFNFLCLSNANQEFITIILEDRNLMHVFPQIITNPAQWDSSGLLKLDRRIKSSEPQHNCIIGCSANMCKGNELDAFIENSGHQFDRVIYVGDGSNDFCPALRLRSQDLVLCRSNMGLHRRISKEGGLKCQYKLWEEAWEIEETFDSFVASSSL